MGIPLLLVLLVVMALQFTATQNFLADKGTGWLAEKLKTTVRIGKVKTDWRNSFVLEDFYMEDQQGDTLVHAGRLGLDINFFSLLKSNINISSARLQNATVHLKTILPDSTTNYDFVLNAFAADTATAQPADTTAKPFTYTLGNVELENIFFTMDDQIYGNQVRSRLGYLQGSFQEVSPEKEIYRIQDVTLRNSYANIVQTKVPDATDTTETGPLTMQFGLGSVALEKVKFNYQNTVAAQRVMLDIGKTELQADNIDLPKARIDLNSFRIENSTVAYFQDKYKDPKLLAIDPVETAMEIDSAVEKSQGKPVDWVATLKNLDVSGLKVAFGNYNTPEQARGMDFNHLDFSGIQVDLDDLYLSQNRIAADLNSMRLKEKSGFQVKHFRADIRVDSTRAELGNLYLETGESVLRRYLALGYPSLETMADHLDQLRIDADLANTKIGFRDLLYFQPALANNPSFRSILNRPLYVDGRITGRMDNLRVQRFQAAGLNGTAINVSGTITGLPDVDKTQAKLDINRFTASRADILAFLPPGSLPPGYQVPSRVSLSGSVRGGMQALALQNIQLQAGPNTSLQASGTMRNLADPDRLYANLNIRRFATTRADIQGLLPDNLIPPTITLPERLAMSGTFTGSLENFSTNSSFTTSFGDAKANIRMSPGERYNGTVSLEKFNLGRLMQMDSTLGTITTTARVNGSGLTPETMQADIDATIAQVQYNKYNYNNIVLKGRADRNVFSGQVNMKDQHLAFNFDGKVNMRGAEPAYAFTLNLDEANLQALNFFDQPLRLQGKVVADLRGTSLNTLQGTLDAGKLTVRQNAKTYMVDSLFLRLANQVGRTDIAIRSDIVNGYFRGANSAEDLATAFSKYIDSYFDIQEAPFPANVNLNDFNFDFRLRRTDLLTAGFVPELKKLGPGMFSGNYRQAGRQLTVDGYLPQVVYTTYSLDSVQLQLRGDAAKIDYGLTLNELSDSTMLVKNLKVGGFAQDDNLKLRVGISEDNGQERFALGGLLNSLPAAYRFQFTQGDVVFNSQAWDVSPNNYLQYFTKTGDVYASDVRLENQGKALTFDSPGGLRANAPLQIGFSNFQLSDISQAIERSDSLISGTLNGQVTLQDIATKMGFTSDLTVSQFAYQKNLIGDIGLKASTAAGDRYNLNATLTGNGNDLAIAGYYVAQTTSNALNLNADIRRLNLAAFEGFGAGMVEDLLGTVNGQLAITGSVSQPLIRGNADFRDATFTLSMLGAKYRLANESIRFDEQGLNFNNFTIADSLNNKALVNGRVLTQNYLDYRFALDVDANNFIAMNSTKADNELFWGKLLIDADAKISGDMNRPVVNTNVKVLDGSALTMVIPAAAAGRVAHEGIVDFVDMSDTLAARLSRLKSQRDTLATSSVTGIDVNAILDISENTPFTVVIDEAAGDFIEIRGKGLMNAGIDPSGKINLSGRYEATAGKYQLNFFALAKREFDIEPGSSITWNGDPLDADVDVRALYHIDTDAAELIVDQVQDERTVNRFRQKYPFEVVINVLGDLLKPNISFDIRLPENARSGIGGQIAQRLQMLRQDPSELNRQVFSLIVLGRFMAQDPLQSEGGGGGLASVARNSVSQVLSDQLNKMTGKFFGGLGLELGLNSYQDYSSGEGQGQNRTDLNVALNQQFLNDRLIVQVGTDIGLEGRNPAQSSSGGGFAGNLSVEYMILPDGRLRVRGFKRNAAEMLTESDVQETGLALIFVRDFNNFADLFRKMEKAPERQ